MMRNDDEKIDKMEFGSSWMPWLIQCHLMGLIGLLEDL